MVLWIYVDNMALLMLASQTAKHFPVNTRPGGDYWSLTVQFPNTVNTINIMI